ncbi:MAG: hypothetical protein V3T53_01185 [Phycisphaerales bacterium]
MNDCIRRNVFLLLVSLIAGAALLGSVLVLKLTELTPPWRIAVALMPLPFYIAMFVVAVRVTRQLDELKQRIQLEALAYASIGMLLSTISYGMLLKADVGMPALDWEWVWVVTVVFYAAGNVIAWRRFR